jgi:geranylgeranyl pyrophosphate synthase
LGGKHVRVVAALLIHELFDHKFKEEAVRVGGLIEHLHCASLIIDDIEDDSVQRRGKP